MLRSASFKPPRALIKFTSPPNTSTISLLLDYTMNHFCKEKIFNQWSSQIWLFSWNWKTNQNNNRDGFLLLFKPYLDLNKKFEIYKIKTRIWISIIFQSKKQGHQEIGETWRVLAPNFCEFNIKPLPNFAVSDWIQ